MSDTVELLRQGWWGNESSWVGTQYEGENLPTFTTGEGAAGLVIGERYFIPNYGYTIREYV